MTEPNSNSVTTCLRNRFEQGNSATMRVRRSHATVVKTD